MNVIIIAMGRLKDSFFLNASREYEKMISGFAKISICEIEAVRLPENPSKAQIDAALATEADKIRTKIPPASYVAAMCIEGLQLSSEKFAGIFEKAGNTGKSNVAFIIGSSYGLDDTLKKQADLRMSMSEMTFPHRLARIMLLEQIYRGFSISAGRKYHK